jgi:hypothetical protein
MNSNNWWAKLISMVLHPLLMPTLAVIILFLIPSYITMSLPPQARKLIVGLVFANTCIAPVLIIFLMKKTGLITDVSLNERADRIYPTLVSVFFYFFTFYLFRQANLPSLLHFFIMGAGILVLLGFVISLYWKISFHLLSMGGFTGFLIVLSVLLQLEMPLLIIGAIILSGILGSARLKLNAHIPSQVYTGYLTGIMIMMMLFFYLRG